MRRKILITVNGKTMNLAGWARECGVSRQRIYTLYEEGRLTDWINGERLLPGRPLKKDAIRRALQEPCTAEEACNKAGCSLSTFYEYIKANNVKKEDGKYVESD